MFLPIFKIAQSNIRLKKTIVSIDRVYDILNQKSSIKQELPFFYGNIERGTIIFKNVSFSYAPDLMLFNELNLDIQENCFNGIVGESGEGKSTLVNLIMRLWDVGTRILMFIFSLYFIANRKYLKYKTDDYNVMEK